MKQPYPTKLDRFLHKHGIKALHLAHAADYSRQHLLRIRAGKMEPTRKCIKAIVAACRSLSRTPVRAADLFDLEEE